MTTVIHWLETAVKFGTPIGTIACNATVDPDTVVTVRPADATCRRCKRTRAWKTAAALGGQP